MSDEFHGILASFRDLSRSLGYDFVPPKPMHAGLTSSLFVVSGLEVLWPGRKKACTVQECISLSREGRGTSRTGFFHSLSILSDFNHDAVEGVLEFAYREAGCEGRAIRLLYPASSGVPNRTSTHFNPQAGPDIPFRIAADGVSSLYFRAQVLHSGNWITILTFVPLPDSEEPKLMDVSIQAERLAHVREGVSRVCDSNLYRGVKRVAESYLGLLDPQLIDDLRTAAAIVALTSVVPGGKGHRHTLRKLIRGVRGASPMSSLMLGDLPGTLLLSSLPAHGTTERLRSVLEEEWNRYGQARG